LLASSVPYTVAVFSKTLNYSTAMALTALTVFLLGIAVILLGPEKKGVPFGS